MYLLVKHLLILANNLEVAGPSTLKGNLFQNIFKTFSQIMISFSDNTSVLIDNTSYNIPDSNNILNNGRNNEGIFNQGFLEICVTYHNFVSEKNTSLKRALESDLQGQEILASAGQNCLSRKTLVSFIINKELNEDPNKKYIIYSILKIV